MGQGGSFNDSVLGDLILAIVVRQRMRMSSIERRTVLLRLSCRDYLQRLCATTLEQRYSLRSQVNVVGLQSFFFEMG